MDHNVDRDLDDEDISEDLFASLREMFDVHYTKWLDKSIPALDGNPPHEAANDPELRSRLGNLLKEFENTSERSHRLPKPPFAKLRSELGLDK